MIVERWVVLLDETEYRQTWLAYNCVGRIGTSRFAEAWRFDTEQQAKLSLKRIRRDRRWPRARVVATTMDASVSEES